MAETVLPYLSLIIPAFNEDRRIGSSLHRILEYLHSQPHSFEVIIVDDGSWDRTVEIARQAQKSDPAVRVERQLRNLGKGEAIRKGMLAAHGRYLFFSDADLSVPIESLPRFLSRLESDADVAIGSRRVAGAIIEVHQPLYRELMGKVFTRLSNLVLNLPTSDFTCGFKGFRQKTARELFSRQQLGGWSFDPEILFIAKLKNYRVAEIPVHWRNDGATKVKLWRDVARSFLGLVCIRLYGFKGVYR